MSNRRILSTTACIKQQQQNTRNSISIPKKKSWSTMEKIVIRVPAPINIFKFNRKLVEMKITCYKNKEQCTDEWKMERDIVSQNKIGLVQQQKDITLTMEICKFFSRRKLYSTNSRKIKKRKLNYLFDQF